MVSVHSLPALMLHIQPIATVWILKENIGISSDKEGTFVITSKFYPIGTLRFSLIGYKDKFLTVLQDCSWISTVRF